MNALGKIILIVDVSLLLPLFWALFTNGPDIMPFLYTIMLATVVGGLLSFAVRSEGHIRAREGFLIVASTWVVVSMIGALPFTFSDQFPDFSSAFFETMSGFTTTGASVLTDVEALSEELLLWRALTQWLGGLGVVVLFVAILSQLDTGGVLMFRAESSGPTTERISSHIQDTAIILWITYLILSIVLCVLLLLGGMGFHDALCHTFTTMATGGYSTKNASIAYFDSAYIQWVIVIFMFLAGTTFALFYKSIVKRTNAFWKSEEFRLYTFITIFATVCVFIVLYSVRGGAFEENLRSSAFQVVSIMTTTGFATENYDLWPPLTHLILISLMLIGGCYGSTSGSLKVGTYLLIFKNFKNVNFSLLHPRAVSQIRTEGKAINPDVVIRVLEFFALFVLFLFGGALVMAALGFPFEEAFSASLTAISNTGPGFGDLGPAENYSIVPPLGKWVLSFLMLLGRLELYTVLVIFTPAFWRQ